MKKKLLSIVLCFALIFGCCAAFTPSVVQAKKFSKKKVKVVKIKPDAYMIPEDDIMVNELLIFINKNKQMAKVKVTVDYYKDKENIIHQDYDLNVAQVGYVGLGNVESSYDYYKYKITSIKKSKSKQIPKKKVKIKLKKIGNGTKKVTIKNTSKSNGVFQIVNLFYNKKGKVTDMEATYVMDLKKKKKDFDYLNYKPKTYLGKTLKYKKRKTFYNFVKY